VELHVGREGGFGGAGDDTKVKSSRCGDEDKREPWQELSHQSTKVPSPWRRHELRKCLMLTVDAGYDTNRKILFISKCKWGSLYIRCGDATDDCARVF
jgi:hypothetical protein